MEKHAPSFRASHYFSWRGGAGRDSTTLEKNHVRLPKNHYSPPSIASQNEEDLSRTVWEALPAAQRKKILTILIRMVMDQLATPSSEKEVSHDE